MSFWWGFCITIIAGYNGNLMSFMANPGLNPAIDTVPKLVDAVKKGDIDVGLIKNTAEYSIFSKSEEPDLLLILKNMRSDPRNFVHHDVEGLRECLRRSYAYVGGWLTVQADVWDPRLFLFAKDSFLHGGYAIAFSDGFDYVDIFNRKILQLREAGLVQKWILDLIDKKQHRGDFSENKEVQGNEDNAEGSNNALKVDDVQGAFAVVIIGWLVAIICCSLENYTFWKKGKKRNTLHRQNRLRRW